MDLTKLEKLALLRIEERKIKAQIEELLPQVNAEVAEAKYENGQPLQVSTGIFTVNYKRTWKFPDYVMQKEAEVDALKDKAKQVGDATYEEKPTLLFKEAKE